MIFSSGDSTSGNPDDWFEMGEKWLPRGFYVTSIDGRVAQERGTKEHQRLWAITLIWDDKSKTWVRSTITTSTGAFGGNDLLFAHHGGRDGKGAYYYWDKQRQLWIDIIGPPKPPPEGASLSPDSPGYAGAMTAQGFANYQWSEDEERWIRVDDLPLGFTDRSAPKIKGRLEAVSLDDRNIRIYWDGKKKSWIDMQTDRPPEVRPPPPVGPFEAVDFIENGNPNLGDLVKTEREHRYFMWNRVKKRWVMLTDPPEGFTRGENPVEAYMKGGSALDRWILWDNSKEAWVDFGPERRFNMHGKVSSTI